MNGVQQLSLWRGLLGVDQATIIEAIEYDPTSDLVVAHVRPTKKLKPRCGVCQARCGRYDPGEGRRRWRALDLGSVKAVLEADAPRVACPTHGVVVAKLPWARHAAGHTRFFDQQVAWLATQCSKVAVTALMRIAWRTVGSIIDRVWADTQDRVDLFANLHRIGIDEISYKKGHKYLTVVVCHDTGRLIWVGVGKTKATLRNFFDALEASEPGRCAQITHVSADGADWIGDVVAESCPNAIRAADPFHVVSWATEALDEVRRDAWNDARKLAGLNQNVAGVDHPRMPQPGQQASGQKHSKAPDTRCGKTPRIWVSTNRPNWPGSPKPTPNSTGPTCSKKGYARSSN